MGAPLLTRLGRGYPLLRHVFKEPHLYNSHVKTHRVSNFLECNYRVPSEWIKR